MELVTLAEQMHDGVVVAVFIAPLAAGLVVVVGENDVEDLAAAELDMSAIVVIGSTMSGCGAHNRPPSGRASTMQQLSASKCPLAGLRSWSPGGGHRARDPCTNRLVSQ